jgi:hypothetical protein
VFGRVFLALEKNKKWDREEFTHLHLRTVQLKDTWTLKASYLCYSQQGLGAQNLLRTVPVIIPYTYLFSSNRGIYMLVFLLPDEKTDRYECMNFI